MNKGYVAAMAFYVASVLLVSMVIVGYATAVRDVSWIEPIKGLIGREYWRPNATFYGLADWSFFLYENGEEEYFLSESHDELTSFVNDVLNRNFRQVKSVIPEGEVDELLGSCKVLRVTHRFSSRSGNWRAPNRFYSLLDYNHVFLVLEDNLGIGLEGTILVQEQIREEPYFKYSVWEITDWLLW